MELVSINPCLRPYIRRTRRPSLPRVHAAKQNPTWRRNDSLKLLSGSARFARWLGSAWPGPDVYIVLLDRVAALRRASQDVQQARGPVALHQAQIFGPAKAKAGLARASTDR